jgi:phage shock protein C
MFCTQCGTELKDQDRFCSQCGNPAGGSAPAATSRRALTRDMRNKKIAGVCAGFARYMDMDVVMMRIIWLAVAVCTGVGFIAYVVAWFLMPKDQPPVPSTATEFARQNG